MTERTDPREAGARPQRPQPRRLKVTDLMAGEREAILEHDGHDYRLRITASGKLILTK
jgi:hemin uptake protein HemP